MFIPTTKEEMTKLGWDKCDIILVTGDAYIDSPYIGVSVIGHVLMKAGYKVGVIAQPTEASPKSEIRSPKLNPTNNSAEATINNRKSTSDITRLGEPGLFWGVTAGCVDSMVSNHTALRKPRREDDFTPGGVNNLRPDRATIAYTNLIKQYFKNTVPIVLGGIEASLRRVAHYDFWDDAVRRPILFDAKADYLVYGMGEKAVVQLAETLNSVRNPKSEVRSEDEIQNLKSKIQNIKGICSISNDVPEGYVELPSFDECKNDKDIFTKMFKEFYSNNLTPNAKGLAQKVDTRYLIQNPPQPEPTTPELDSYYELPYERDAHPYYKEKGKVKALDTIRFSITSHRGCFGQCNFCAITAHQGRAITDRSEASILREVHAITKIKGFTGIINDVGGPTANMYGMTCTKAVKWGCRDKKCLYPETCPSLENSHKKQLDLLRKIESVYGVKKVFVASGIRYDLLASDLAYKDKYFEELVEKHTSGQLKIAPEHTDAKVLGLMNKPAKGLKEFVDKFYMLNAAKGKKQFLTYYLIAAHPGCGVREMDKMKEYLEKELKAHPEQVQVFTPTPSTFSSLMYYTEKNPWTGEKVFVEKNPGKKAGQKEQITGNKESQGEKPGWHKKPWENKHHGKPHKFNHGKKRG